MPAYVAMRAKNRGGLTNGLRKEIVYGSWVTSCGVWPASKSRVPKFPLAGSNATQPTFSTLVWPWVPMPTPESEVPAKEPASSSATRKVVVSVCCWRVLQW